MSLKEKINNDLKEALKQKDAFRLSVLRLLNSSIGNKEIEKLKKEEGLSDDEIITVITNEIKKRRDSADIYTKAGRQELAQKEENELKILMGYLPEQLTDDELKNIVKEAIGKIGATGEKDFGLVMKEVLPKIKGRADGALVAKLVKELLK